MLQKEYYNLGEAIAAEAWESFERWCKEYDPEGNMDTIDLAAAYSEWSGATSSMT